jgi:hypothetical protein
MKQILLLILTIGLLAIQSCDDNIESVSTQIQPQKSLAGKVYGLTTFVYDTAKCAQALPSNANLPRILFLDNSSFIKIVPTNCENIENDFTCSRNYSGKYKIDDKLLTLTFDQKMVLHFIKAKNNQNSMVLKYVKGKNNSKITPPILSSHVEFEKSDMTIETLVILQCKSATYFEPCDVQGHFMTPTTDTLTNHIKYLIDEKIWENLFGIK